MSHETGPEQAGEPSWGEDVHPDFYLSLDGQWRTGLQCIDVVVELVGQHVTDW